jgi:hypothetical protein
VVDGRARVTYRIAIDGLLSEFADGESVLLDLTRKRYHTLNETAAFIWTLLEKTPLAGDEIAKRLIERYDIDQARADAAVTRFAEDLTSMGLVEKA